MAQVLSPSTRTGTPVPPGVNVLNRRQLAFQRRVILFMTITPFVGVATAIAGTWGWGVSALDLTLFVAFYLFTGFGITVGFHRLLTHRSFEPKRWVRGLFAVAGSMAVEGDVIKWVADHRRHHAFSDQAGDPHSPHLVEEPGLRGVLKGLWHAHMGWFFDGEMTDPQRWAPDIVKDPMMRRIGKLFTPLTITSFVLPAAIGLVATQSWRGAVTAFLWGSLARVFLLHHVTWSVNSICHFYGRRPYETTDKSTNNWPLAVISFGESWHNNHHAFPTSAFHGLRRLQIDPGRGLIRMFVRLRLIEDVHRPSPKQMVAKQAG
ncbi:MAG: acyl-CoA desaturase [Actinomycetota bacterium]